MKNSTVHLPPLVPAPHIMRAEPWPDKGDRHGAPPEVLDTILPGPDQWAELLGVDEVAGVEKILRRALLDPIGELNSAPGKRIRAQLVSFSYRLFGGDLPAAAFANQRCRLAAEAVELIHAGSLIIDDIEDGSVVRRGRPALHLRFPMPIALNAGNWLYFWPFDLLREVAVSRDQLLHLYESCHRTLLRAHFGQAIDLGAKIDRLEQTEVKDICMVSMRLKTGALMGFAALLGAAVAGTSNALLTLVEEFGRDLGVGLQMFDDLGNAIGKCEPAKRYEDLLLARPSWVWAGAAQNSTAAEYQRFLRAVRRLPDTRDLEGWLTERGMIEHTRRSARTYLDSIFAKFEKRLNGAGARWSRRALDELRDLGDEIAVAYG